ncbi:hypothetical protein J6590_023931 [Homalodisca vitripennis]|nr:hypothetical protein J6590_023931 [Homalodisca vitripennis]
MDEPITVHVTSWYLDEPITVHVTIWYLDEAITVQSPSESATHRYNTTDGNSTRFPHPASLNIHSSSPLSAGVD